MFSATQIRQNKSKLIAALPFSICERCVGEISIRSANTRCWIFSAFHREAIRFPIVFLSACISITNTILSNFLSKINKLNGNSLYTVKEMQNFFDVDWYSIGYWKYRKMLSRFIYSLKFVLLCITYWNWRGYGNLLINDHKCIKCCKYVVSCKIYWIFQEIN